MVGEPMSYTPTAEMARAAHEGLARRKKVGHGGTASGVAMARKIERRAVLSLADVRKIAGFHARFAQHDGRDPYSKVAIARLLWGGKSARAWARKHSAASQKATRKKAVRKNPVGKSQTERAMRKAVRLFSDFHGEHPKFVDQWEVIVPPVAMQIGTVTGIMYKTRMDGKVQEFLHEFTGKSRPILAASADGRQLLFLGGDYKMTERGIVDGSYTIER